MRSRNNEKDGLRGSRQGVEFLAKSEARPETLIKRQNKKKGKRVA